MSSMLTLPLASGIIDDLIVKAKVFGTSPGQFLLSFLIFYCHVNHDARDAKKPRKFAALVWGEL